ncbi:MAG: ATP-binding protein [Bacillota bacterium]
MDKILTLRSLRVDKEYLVELITDFQNVVFRTQGIERYCESEIFATIGSKPIKIISGFRRVGKSHLARRIALRAVREKLYLDKNVLFLNFEHFGLQNACNPGALNEIYKLFCSTVADNGQRKLLIFDEIQRVVDWDKFIRTLYEMYGDEIEIILTGSNSELLSAEIGSNLAGRFIEFQLLPFSFSEYLTYNSSSVSDKNELRVNRAKIENMFSSYMRTGGLPETLTISEEGARYSYLQGVFSKVILDDVIERFRVRNVGSLEKIFQYIVVNSGNVLSIAQITKYLRYMDNDIKQNTVLAYVEMIKKTFALFEVSRFDWKLKKIFDVTKKYYCIDTGLVNSFAHNERNSAKLLESIVFIELLRRGGKISFVSFSNKKEIDFITRAMNGRYTKYQVTLQLTEENFPRETSAFFQDEEHLDKADNVLLFLSRDKNVDINTPNNINFCDLIIWLLDIK